jgi:hypothetical protein
VADAETTPGLKPNRVTPRTRPYQSGTYERWHKSHNVSPRAASGVTPIARRSASLASLIDAVAESDTREARYELYVRRAVDIASAYAAVFGSLARELGVYIVAGALTVPPMDDSPHTGGWRVLDDHVPHNVSPLFGPRGWRIGRTAKVRIPPCVDRFSDPGGLVALYPAETRLGRTAPHSVSTATTTAPSSGSTHKAPRSLPSPSISRTRTSATPAPVGSSPRTRTSVGCSRAAGTSGSRPDHHRCYKHRAGDRWGSLRPAIVSALLEV